MEVKEKGNFLVLYFSKDEDVLVGLSNVVREYLIIDAKASGFGFFHRTEYGVLEAEDPIFFKKNLCEKLLTTTQVFGLIQNREVNLFFNGIDKDLQMHAGKLYSAQVSVESVLILDIIKTD